MRLLPILALVLAGAAVAGCGTTRENRFNETAYADHSGPYDHDVVYRTRAYGDRYYEDDGRIVYVRPAYRLVPAAPAHVVYGGDGYYYYDE